MHVDETHERGGEYYLAHILPGASSYRVGLYTALNAAMACSSSLWSRRRGWKSLDRMSGELACSLTWKQMPKEFTISEYPYLAFLSLTPSLSPSVYAKSWSIYRYVSFCLNVTTGTVCVRACVYLREADGRIYIQIQTYTDNRQTHR